MSAKKHERLKREGVYTGAWAQCFKCGEKTPWWHWPGVPFCETPPPEPRPRVLEYRYSKMFGGSYWMNTCIACGVTQGDNFVFMDRKSPLYKLPRRELPPDIGSGRGGAGKGLTVNEAISRMVGRPTRR